MGRGASGETWRAYQVPALVAAGYSVITFDNRGSGVREGEVSPRGFFALVEDVLELQQECGGPAALVGTSLGARVALEAALVRPAGVSAVVAAAGHGRLSPVQLAYGREVAEATEYLARHHPDFLASVVATLNLSPRTIADPAVALDWLALLRHSAVTGPGLAWQASLDEVSDRLPAYRGITVPVLALAFADDRVITPQQVYEVADAVPGGEYAELPDTGHYGYLERPEAFNRLILDFLRRHVGT